MNLTTQPKCELDLAHLLKEGEFECGKGSCLRCGGPTVVTAHPARLTPDMYIVSGLICRSCIPQEALKANVETLGQARDMQEEMSQKKNAIDPAVANELAEHWQRAEALQCAAPTYHEQHIYIYDIDSIRVATAGGMERALELMRKQGDDGPFDKCRCIGELNIIDPALADSLHKKD